MMLFEDSIEVACRIKSQTLMFFIAMQYAGDCLFDEGLALAYILYWYVYCYHSDMLLIKAKFCRLRIKYEQQNCRIIQY